MRKMFNKIVNVLFTDNQWLLAWRNLGAKKWMVIEQPKNVSRADPFIICEKGIYYLFFEEFDRNVNRGIIRVGVLDINRSKLNNIQTILDTGYHCSFPFIIKVGGKYYFTAETTDQNCLNLYEFTNFPYVLCHKKKILEDISAVDPVVYKNKDGYFLMVNKIDENGSYDNNVTIYYSKSLLEENFCLVDSINIGEENGNKTLRNAGGIIEYEGNLLRPVQDCRIRYGHNIYICKVDALSPSEYKESFFLDTRKPWKFIANHTLNRHKGIEVTDFKRTEILSRRVLGNLLKFVRYKLKHVSEIRKTNEI